MSPVLSFFESVNFPSGNFPVDFCAMQYVRSISGSVSKTWNSINPATLSGAIDVIVIEQEDGETSRRSPSAG